MMSGDANVESGWAVWILSPTLSWLDSHQRALADAIEGRETAVPVFPGEGPGDGDAAAGGAGQFASAALLREELARIEKGSSGGGGAGGAGGGKGGGGNVSLDIGDLTKEVVLTGTGSNSTLTGAAAGPSAELVQACQRLPKQWRVWLCRRVARAAARRALTFPYMRRWDVAKRALNDVCTIMTRGGRRGALRCMLQVRRGGREEWGWRRDERKREMSQL